MNIGSYIAAAWSLIDIFMSGNPVAIGIIYTYSQTFGLLTVGVG